MNKRLDGRVAVITGGAGGLGAATAERMVAEGARVVIAEHRSSLPQTAEIDAWMKRQAEG
jgi:NAD(P)-dependent dehydrogenase (short-subunit alcohol dehydrogenase family)